MQQLNRDRQETGFEAMKDLLSRHLPERGFEGTEFAYPLLYAITGRRLPDAETLRRGLKRVEEEAGGHSLDALWLAEVAESLQGDRDRLFVTDDRFREMCVGLNEGSNGWGLIVGDADGRSAARLSSSLAERRFRLFVAGSASAAGSDEGTTILGPRATSMVYFAQLLARYALIYGRAPAGDPHEISHFVEDYAPGVVFVVGGLGDVEGRLVQGMLTLGAPVVALGDGRGLLGPVKVSSTVEGMVEAAWRLPNVRARLVERATPAVPVPVGRVFQGEEVAEEDVAWELNGSEASFMVVRPSTDVDSDSVRVAGDPNKASDFCILVELGNPRADGPVTLWVESVLRQVVNHAKGVKVRARGDGGLRFVVARSALEAGFTLEHLGNLIATELRNELPELGPVRVTFLLDAAEAGRARREVEAFLEERAAEVEEATDESVDQFYGCTRCQSFSLAHACTVTPDRPSQCGVRPWYRVKAQAILDPESAYNPSVLIEKGACLDPARGEYEGVNRSAEERTRGRVRRVFLHSIFSHPHTACSCFQNIAFHIPEVDGLGLMNRGFKGRAPNGETWTTLANRIAGRQFGGGVASFGNGYLRSRRFLQGDGGYGRVVWMTEALMGVARQAIPSGLRGSIATERSATTMDELRRFLAEKNRGTT